jgi:hypothetical protein
MIVRGGQKINLRFQIYTRNKQTRSKKFAATAVDRETRKVLSQNKPLDCCCASLPLDASSSKGGFSPTTNLLVGSAVREGGVSNRCETRISVTISLEIIQP